LEVAWKLEKARVAADPEQCTCQGDACSDNNEPSADMLCIRFHDATHYKWMAWLCQDILPAGIMIDSATNLR
jgi:hypothetical protein